MKAEAEKDLINLLQQMPIVKLPNDFAFLVFTLRKKYNVPITTGTSQPQPNKN